MSYLAPFQNRTASRSDRQNPPHDIDIILPEGSPVSGAQMFVDLFQAANDVVTAAPYRVSVRNLSMPVNEDPKFWQRRTVVFLGDIQSRWAVGASQRGRLCRIFHLSTRTVLVGGAVFLLRDAGQQDGHDLAIHPNFLAAADEEHLAPASSGQHFTTSGTISSASSSFAALRLMLDLIEEDHGQFLSQALGTYLGLIESRDQPQSKVALHLRQRACGDPLIGSVLDLMLQHIEEPLQIRELSQHAGVSTRKLERRFQDKTGTTPLTAYRLLRIERAHELLVHTNLSLSEIVVATGFGSRTNLRHWFKKEYGDTPQGVRQDSFSGKRPIALPAFG